MRAGVPFSRAAARTASSAHWLLMLRSMPAAMAARTLSVSCGVHSQASTGAVIPAARRARASSMTATPSQLAPPSRAARALGSRPCPYPSALTTAMTSAGVPERNVATLRRIAARSTTASVRGTPSSVPQPVVASLQEVPLGRVLGARDRRLVRLRGLCGASETPEQVGAHGVEQVVAIEVEGVHQIKRRVRAVDLRDR